MPKRIPDEVRDEINRLYDAGRGMSPKEIARRIGVPYSSVYGMTRARQRTNPETGKPFESRGEYAAYQARQRTNPKTGKPFESLGEYAAYQARQRTNPETGKPFESRGEYEAYQARQRTNPETGKPFESRGELQAYQARQRTNPETGKPFESLGELQAYQARQRSKKERNRELSDFVKKRLKWMGLNQSWLAEEMDVSREAVRLYVTGKSIPRGENLRKLLLALDVRRSTRLPKSLEDLVVEEL